MIIEQGSMDDAVLLLRAKSLLGYIGGLIQDRPRRELPEELRKIAQFVEENAFCGGVELDGTELFHAYYLVEVLTEEIPVGGQSLKDISYNIVDGSWSGEVSMSPTTPVSRPLMGELLLSQGSDPDFLDNDYEPEYEEDPDQA